MTVTLDQEINDAAEILANSNYVVVLSGAGISTESGIPTFRENQSGIWANYNPEDLATVNGFLKDPVQVWNWYNERRMLIAEVKPNPGHYALADMEKSFKNFLLITQNIDNLHQRAGSQNICELHGNIFQYKCFGEDKII